VQYFAIKKNAKRREPTNTGWKPRLKGEGSGRFKPPCPSPPFILLGANQRKKLWAMFFEVMT